MDLNAPRHEIPVLPLGQGNIPLFIPEIPADAFEEVKDTLESRWIGQGPKVDRFEVEFNKCFVFDFAIFILYSFQLKCALRMCTLIHSNVCCKCPRQLNCKTELQN